MQPLSKGCMGKEEEMNESQMVRDRMRVMRAAREQIEDFLRDPIQGPAGKLQGGFQRLLKLQNARSKSNPIMICYYKSITPCLQATVLEQVQPWLYLLLHGWVSEISSSMAAPQEG